ncbi:MAG: hypothetical protein WC082_05045 [Victivallales bacterium]
MPEQAAPGTTIGVRMNEILSLANSHIAAMPTFSGIWWGWLPVAATVLAGFMLYSFNSYRKSLKERNKNSWNDYFTDPPEYTDPVYEKQPQSQELFQKYLHDFWHKNSPDLNARARLLREMAKYQGKTKNFFLWDDGLIFCGFKLQGTDLRTANLYGAYLRDMLLRERNLDGSYKPLIFRDTEAYPGTDMSTTFLKSGLLEVSDDGADIGRVDLSGLYLRDIGLQGINIGDFLKPDKPEHGDCFLPE